MDNIIIKGNLYFKKTTIGLIPKDWKLKKLEQVVKFLDSDREPIKESERAKMQGKYPYYGASGIIDYVNDYIFDDDLILLGEDGANILNRSSPLAFKVSGKCWVNNHAHVLKPKENIELGYVLEYLESIRYEKYNTSTAQPKLNQSVCRSIPIPVPPLTEQKRIAEIFSIWDQAISKTEKLIEAKKRYKKGLMQRLLSGKVRFSEFEGEDWVEVRLGYLLREVKRMDGWDDEKLYELISVRRRSGGIFHRENLYGHEIKTKNLKKIKTDDFLISRMQIVHGASAVVSPEFEDLYVSNSYHTLVKRDSIELDMSFFNYISQLPYFYHLTYISSYGVHIEKMTFNLKDFLKKKVKIPKSEAEQQKIASVLKEADKEIDLLETQKQKFEKQKKGLMQKLLTGKIRLKHIDTSSK